MIFFPIIELDNLIGWTSLNSFPPNNWEIARSNKFYVYLLFIENDQWKSKLIKTLGSYENFYLDQNDINKITYSESIKILCLSKSKIKDICDFLPSIDFQTTSLPTWRASIGLKNDTHSSSYQGEIIPFGNKSSFLTFAPFIQNHNSNLENYLIFSNLEKTTDRRYGQMNFSQLSNPEKILKTENVQNNKVNIINLNDINYLKDDVPLISCNNMAGLPIFATINKITNAISIEHTHPGASFVVHGNRWVAQKILKEIWQDRIKDR